jgi:hypothetical protein
MRSPQPGCGICNAIHLQMDVTHRCRIRGRRAGRGGCGTISGMTVQCVTNTRPWEARRMTVMRCPCGPLVMVIVVVRFMSFSFPVTSMIVDDQRLVKSAGQS